MSKPETARILVVDWEPNLRGTLSLILERAGYQVSEAANPAETCLLLQAGPFDLLLLDIQLPGADRLAFLADIFRHYPSMPVFILTTGSCQEAAVEAVRMGAKGYLLKPADPPLILAHVEHVLWSEAQPRAPGTHRPARAPSP